MRWLYRFLALATIGPWVFWLGCFGAVIVLGGIFGCNINEGSVQPCVIAGRDLGEFAYTAGFMAAWGVLILGPISLLGGLAWAVTAIAHNWWKRRTGTR